MSDSSEAATYVSKEAAEDEREAEDDQARKETAEDDQAPQETAGHDQAQKEPAGDEGELFQTALDVAAASAGKGWSGYNNMYDCSKGKDKGKDTDKGKDNWRKGKGNSKDKESKGNGKGKDYNEICEVVLWLHKTVHKQARIIVELRERMLTMEQDPTILNDIDDLRHDIDDLREMNSEMRERMVAIEVAMEEEQESRRERDFWRRKGWSWSPW